MVANGKKGCLHGYISALTISSLLLNYHALSYHFIVNLKYYITIYNTLTKPQKETTTLRVSSSEKSVPKKEAAFPLC